MSFKQCTNTNMQVEFGEKIKWYVNETTLMSGLEINILVISETSLSPLHNGKN